jgi:membrane protease YdiL (CAAX protease family)
VPEVKELVALLFAWLGVTVAGGWAAALTRVIVGYGVPTFSPQRRRAVVWTGPLVAGVFVMLIVAPGAVLALFGRDRLVSWFYGAVPEPDSARIVAGSIADVLGKAVVVLVWWRIIALAGYPGAALGLTPRRWVADFFAAYRTWLVLTPVVYATNLIVTVVYALRYHQPPEEHPIIQVIRHGPPAGFVALLAAQAIIAAPVCEEVVFRGALLPWLATRPWGGALALALAAGAGVMLRPADELQWNDAASVISWLAPALLVVAVIPLYRWPVLARWLPVRDPKIRRQVARAIIGSAALFANFHASVWPTPIPLFVLAVGLGWLAYRTQGLVAPIVVHVMFNAIVFVVLLLSH